jgi:hypothetical protein
LENKKESGSRQRSIADFEWLQKAYVQAQENADVLKQMYFEATRNIDKSSTTGKDIKVPSCQHSA